MKPFWLPRPEREMAAGTAPISGAGVPQARRISRDIAEALEQLPHYERAALLFRDVKQCPLDSVARQLGCSVRVARLHIAQGRTTLLRHLAANGIKVV